MGVRRVRYSSMSWRSPWSRSELRIISNPPAPSAGDVSLSDVLIGSPTFSGIWITLCITRLR